MWFRPRETESIHYCYMLINNQPVFFIAKR